MSARRLPRPRLTYANVMSTLGVFIALGGTSYAVTKLPKNSVGTQQLKAQAVTLDKLAAGVAISGPRGPRGAAGPQGAAGTDGLPGPARAEPWQSLGLVSEWQNYGETYAIGQFRKDGAGTVQLRGLLKRSTVAQTTIAVLPPAYRPERREVFVVKSDPDQTGHARIDVDPSGAILYWAGTSNGAFVSLSGITFAAAG